jgi:HlyD family secretion protein
MEFEELGVMMADRWIWIRNWVSRLSKIALVIGVIAALAYWLRWSPLPVVEHRVKRGDVVNEVMGTGTLEARVKTAVSPKISGRISEVLGDQGDRASAGQLLVRLDDEELTQQVEIARAYQAAAEAGVERVKSDKNRTTAILAQAEQHYERTTKLRQSNAATIEENAKAREAFAVAQAGLANSEAAIAEAQKEMVAAEKTLLYQQARLADTMIIAPFDGLIVARQRDPGDVVVPGSSIFTLISTEQLWVSAWVDETEMGKLAPEQPARVVFRSDPEKSYPGKVVRLGRETDRETREFIVEVSVLELPSNWAVGQRADVFIETAREDLCLRIPPAFLIWRDDHENAGPALKTPGVFLNDSGQARWRPLKIGLRSRDAVQIIEGLSTDDRLIMPSAESSTLNDGRKVTEQ